MKHRLFLLLLLLLLPMLLSPFFSVAPSGRNDSTRPLLNPKVAPTGTHWADVADFSALHKLGYEFVVATVNSADKDGWNNLFNAAKKWHLKLIVGMYPEPYKLQDGKWTVTSQGQEFLRYAASRASLVKAIFVYDEPYDFNPFTRKGNDCGALSAQELRDLRVTIRSVWPEVKIYHDLGTPSEWTPGASYIQDNPCIGNKYADQTKVADVVGIGFYPVTQAGYNKEKMETTFKREIAFVHNQMRAEVIVLGQAFYCETNTCEGQANRFPTMEEMKDMNCRIRALKPDGISWYPWRQKLYQDYLSNHSDYWSLTTASVCR